MAKPNAKDWAGAVAHAAGPAKSAPGSFDHPSRKLGDKAASEGRALEAKAANEADHGKAAALYAQASEKHTEAGNHFAAAGHFRGEDVARAAAARSDSKAEARAKQAGAPAPVAGNAAAAKRAKLEAAKGGGGGDQPRDDKGQFSSK